MFSVIFPGQGSQMVGMGKELYEKYNLVNKLFKEADEILDFNISSLILNGPKDKLDLTENTQPAIFLLGYSLFQLLKKEFGVDLNKASYFAGHSLGEYTALAAAEALSFSDTLKVLKVRGRAMQEAVPKGEGGMIAILGSEIEIIKEIINKNKYKYECFIANDNSNGQLVVSGKILDLDQLTIDLKKLNIKNIRLSVSAPFHCKLMKKATDIMKEEIQKLKFQDSKNVLISNVTASEITSPNLLKELLISQIENTVRWRESIIFMASKGVNHFIEIGPGKVLSGLIKRIDKDLKISTINNEEDIKLLKN